MKQKLLLLFIMSAFSFNSNAQFALGDIAFSAYGAESAANTPSGPVDAFTIVLLRNVSVNEQITFSENGWFVSLGGFRAGESECTLTFGTAYPQGSQIVIGADPFEARDEDGNIAGTMTGSALGLATGGDSIIAYNTSSVPTTSDQSSLIAALNMTGQWTVGGAGSSTSTELPSTMTDGLNAVSIEPEIDNARVAAANCGNFTDISSLRSMLNTASNWETDNGTAYDQSSPVCDFRPTLSIEEQQSLVNVVRLTPNPVQDTFSLSVPNGITINKVIMFDITGKEVLTIKNYANNSIVDMSSMRSGIYLAKVFSGDNTIVKKLIKK